MAKTKNKKPNTPKLNFFSRKGIVITLKPKKHTPEPKKTPNSKQKAAVSKSRRMNKGKIEKKRHLQVCEDKCGFKTTRLRDLVDHRNFSHEQQKKLYYCPRCPKTHTRYLSSTRHVNYHKNRLLKKGLPIDGNWKISKRVVKLETWKLKAGSNFEYDLCRYTVKRIREERRVNNRTEYFVEWEWFPERKWHTWEPKQKIRSIAPRKVKNWIANQQTIHLHDVTL